jgi:hypothetical protein
MVERRRRIREEEKKRKDEWIGQGMTKVLGSSEAKGKGRRTR